MSLVASGSTVRRVKLFGVVKRRLFHALMGLFLYHYTHTEPRGSVRAEIVDCEGELQEMRSGESYRSYLIPSAISLEADGKSRDTVAEVKERSDTVP